MIHSCHQRRSFAPREERGGAAAVELALVLPVFLMIIFGMIEIGTALSVEHMLTDAARRGARKAIISGTTNADVTTPVKDSCTKTLKVSSSDITVEITVTSANSQSIADVSAASTGDICTVTVKVPAASTGVLHTYLKGVTQSSSCTMEHE